MRKKSKRKAAANSRPRRSSAEVRRERLAYHEAGHAVVGDLLGGYVQEIAIEAGDDGSYCWCEHTDLPVSDQLVIQQSGMAALALLRRIRRSGSALTDNLGTGIGDIDRMMELAGSDHAAMESAYQGALALLKEHWANVEKVAAELIEYGIVTGHHFDTLLGVLPHASPERHIEILARHRERAPTLRPTPLATEE